MSQKITSYMSCPKCMSWFLTHESIITTSFPSTPSLSPSRGMEALDGQVQGELPQPFPVPLSLLHPSYKASSVSPTGPTAGPQSPLCHCEWSPWGGHILPPPYTRATVRICGLTCKYALGARKFKLQMPSNIAWALASTQVCDNAWHESCSCLARGTLVCQPCLHRTVHKFGLNELPITKLKKDMVRTRGHVEELE